MNKETSLAKDLFLLASTMTYPLEHRDNNIAISVLIEAIKIFPKEPAYYYYLGLATYMKGDVEEAIKLYQGTIDLDTQRRLEKEEKRSTVSVDGNEDSDNDQIEDIELPLPDVWPALGTAMQALERNNEAIDCYIRANIDNMEDTQKAIFLAHYGMALCSKDIKKFEEGREMTGQAMRLLESHTEVIEAYNYCKHAT
jgi:tetratricopeptide (TPR) repeat protein